MLLAFEPPDGGVPENVAQLALGLRSCGWEPEVAGPPEAAPYRQLGEAGIRIWRLPFGRGYGRPSSELRALVQLRALLRTGRFELAHVHAAKAGVLGRAAAAWCGVPALYSPHCFPFVGRTARGLRLAAIASEALLGRLSDVLCVCEQERALALAHRIAPPERLHVVHNGCAAPDPRRSGLDERIVELKERGPVVGAVATLRAQKRLDLLIEATPIVLAAVPSASVALVGDGPMESQLRRRARAVGLDREPRFEMLPFRRPASSTLMALDLYALPSAWESFPIGLLEAMACGVPQVVSDVGGNREAVTPLTGQVVAPNEPLALARAIVAMLSEPERLARAAEASRLRHAERFGLEQMVRATAAVYDAILARGAAPAVSDRRRGARAAPRTCRRASTRP
ncbi:MAG TPA: glycosyltransferase [Solirubrobacteraceae bacterium]|nr:glycosyltransferase [Solirubrobacteraceae bacterium]